MPTNNITLGGFLAVLESAKPITINLYDQNELLLITFIKDGYNALDDFLCDDSILKITIKNMQTLDITIDTSNN